MADDFDTSGLIQLDATGLAPVEPQLDTSGLIPLDTSGLIPVDEDERASGFGAAFGSALKATPGTFATGLETVGEQSGITPLVSFGKFIKSQAEGAPDTFEPMNWDRIQGIGDAWTWLKEQAGAGIASTIPSIASGLTGAGAGALAGSVIPGVGTAAGGIGGGIAGAASTAVPLNIGDATEQFMAEGIDKDTSQKAGIAIGGLISIPDVLVVGQLTKPFTSAARKQVTQYVVKTIANRIKSGMTLEAATEGLQQMFQEGAAMALGGDATLMERAERVAGATIGGGFGGATVGGTGGVYERMRGLKPSPAGDAAAAGAPSAEARGTALPPTAAAATNRPVEPPIASIPDIGTRVGLRQVDGPPEPVLIEAVQDGYVFFRREDGSQDAAKEGDFRRDLTAAPPPSKVQQPDATTVPSPPREGEPPPPDVGDINDFDPYAPRRPARQPAPPSPQGAMALPETKQIQNLKDGARYLQQTAAEAERIRASGSPNARTAEDIASMRVEAARMLDEATALERRLTPSRTALDPLGATAAQLAGQPLGPLGRAMPAASEATTGPREYPVTPPRTPAAPAQPALAPVARSEAEVPQEPQFQPKAAPVPWQQRLRQQIGNREAKLNDPVVMARDLGTTPEAVTAELRSIAAATNAPIEIMRGKVTKDPKTKKPVQSKRAGKWRYTPRPSGKVSEDLVDFVLSKGGIRPGGFAGELSARDLDKINVPFKGKIVNPNARMSLEDMANAAMQDGFLVPTEAGGIYEGRQDPRDRSRDRAGSAVGTTSANIDAFLEMLEQNASKSRRHYRMGDEPAVEPEGPGKPAPKKTAAERKREATRRLTALGVQPRGTTVAELEAQLDAMLDAIGDAAPIDAMDFARAAETEAVNRMDEDAQEALRQEAPNDFPYEYDDAWIAAEIAEGVRPAQPAADAGVSPGAAQPQAEPGGQAAAGRGPADTAEAAPTRGLEAEQPRIARETDLTKEGQQPVLIEGTRSTKQALAAREAQPRIKPKAPQKEPGGMFAEQEPESGDLFDGLKSPTNPDLKGSAGYGNKTAPWRRLLAGLNPLKRAEKIARFMQTIANDSGVEHGVFIGQDGMVIWAGSAGLKGNIPFTQEVMDELEVGTGKIDLHHNHPNQGGPLSGTDVKTIAYPNAGWIIAYSKDGRFTAARLSDRFRDATERLTNDQRTQVINWAVSNSIAASLNMHRPAFDAGKMSKDQFEINDTAWRALHEAGIIDYLSDYQVPDFSYPILETIQRQISERLIEHGITINRSNRVHRPAQSTGTAAGLAEISGGPGADAAQKPVRGPTGAGGAQGRLLEEAGQRLRSERGAVPPAAQAETGGVLARLMADESGAVPLPDWDKIKAYFNIGRKTPQTARDVAMEGVRMRLGAPDTLTSMSKMARYLRSAVSLAAIDRPSSVYWNAIMRRDHTRAQMEREAIEQVRPYLALSQQSRGRIDKILEHDRLYGIDRKYTGRDVVVRIPTTKVPFGQATPELSKPGEIVALDTKETQALQQLRKFFDQRLMKMGEAMAVERGYLGKFDRASIEEAIANAGSPRERKPAQAAMEVLERTEEMRRLGYVPFQRYGDTYITIKPKNPPSGMPETAWFEMMDTKSVFDKVFSREGGKARSTLADRIAELKKRFPAADYEYQTGSVTPKAIAELNIPALERAFAALNAKQGPGTAKIIDDLMHQVYEARKAGLRKQAENVPGYSTDFERAITDYVRQTSAIIARMSHRQDVDSAYDATQAHAVKEVRDYWKKHKDHTESEGDDYAGLRKLGFFMFLWGSPASAAINLTQTPLVTTMQLGAWAGIRAPQLAHQGMLEGLGAIHVGKNGLELDFDPLGKTDAEKEMIRELRDAGYFDPSLTQQEMQGGRMSTKHRALRPALNRLQQVYDIGASGFNVTEQVNRVAAALAYFRAAQNPQLRERMREVYKNDQNFIEMVARRGMDPVQIAKFGVDETQFIGGKINRAPAMRGIGAVLLQFKTYIANYLRLMHKNFTRMGARGKIAGSLMLLSMLAISGLFGLPFGDDALQAADFLAEKATGIDPNLEFQLRQFIADSGFGEYGAEVMTRGFGRNVFGTGVDVSGRIGMGNIFPDDSITSLAPLITGTYARVSEAMDRWHTDQTYGAMAAMAGAFIGKGGQDIAKGMLAYPMEGVSTKRGNWTLLPDDVSLADMTIRSLGFQPTKVTRAQEAQYQAGRIASATQEARNTMSTRIARLVVMGMEAREAGDIEAAEEYSRQVQALYEANAASLIDPSIPEWQKIKPTSRAAVKARVLSLIKPEIANIRRAAKMTRPTLLEQPFVEP